MKKETFNTYNYSKLCGKIREIYRFDARLAKQLGISRQALSYKLNNKVHFSQDEICRMIDLLGLADSEVGSYFFCTRN